ncbi:helix-turn-helix domain-containing protein [Nocardioides sp. NPDC057772]|uniref:helix-turn-helix domain-containing protein n=1 Tax=Nocardioides sp. NPDC057772 TaxID=3346245 RepID=UPI00366F8FBA
MTISTLNPTRPILRAAAAPISNRGRRPDPERVLGPAASQPRRPQSSTSRRPVIGGATAVALLSTVAAYVAMVGFGRDVLAMGAVNAYAFAGVFELSLVTVALMAREAAQQDRPAQTLLTLTWILSAASGYFAGWHEIHLEHGATAAAFRFVVPLLAALMWHLALVGDRHLATGRSWTEKRITDRMHAMMLTAEAWHRARAEYDANPTRLNGRRLEEANRRRLRARSVVLRTVDPVDMERRVAEWSSALDAVTRGTATAGKSATDVAPARGVSKSASVTRPVTQATVTAVTPDTRPAVTAGTRATAPKKASAGAVTSSDAGTRRAKVAELLEQGKTGEEIAEAVGASLRTVRRDISALQASR